MFCSLPISWKSVLIPKSEGRYWIELTKSIKREYSQKICFPQEQNIFRAFDMTSFEAVKVVILGQDPYHTAGAAMGLAFSISD
jgi:uracil-DNA glycosylase